MKSMFLLTVLFVLLAFAFKDPEQSAWDFAKEVGSNVVQKTRHFSARHQGFPSRAHGRDVAQPANHESPLPYLRRCDH